MKPMDLLMIEAIPTMELFLLLHGLTGKFINLQGKLLSISVIQIITRMQTKESTLPEQQPLSMEEMVSQIQEHLL